MRIRGKSDKSAGSMRKKFKLADQQKQQQRTIGIRCVDKNVSCSKEEVEEARPITFENSNYRQRRKPFELSLSRMKISYQLLEYTTEREEQIRRRQVVRPIYKSCEKFARSIRNANFTVMRTKLTDYIDLMDAKIGEVLTSDKRKAYMSIIPPEEEEYLIERMRLAKRKAAMSATPPDEEEYSVEKICNKQRWNNITRYECKWQNYPPEENTFETLDYLDNSLFLLKHFENSLYNQKDGNVQFEIKEIEDKAMAGIDAVWKSLVHLKYPEEIIAYDTYTGTCWVTFKNLGETAKIHCSQMKLHHPDLWIKFFREHRQEFKRGRVKPIFLLTKQPKRARPQPEESEESEQTN